MGVALRQAQGERTGGGGRANGGVVVLSGHAMDSGLRRNDGWGWAALCAALDSRVKHGNDEVGARNDWVGSGPSTGSGGTGGSGRTGGSG